MGSHYAASNNNRTEAFFDNAALDGALEFAGLEGAVWEMSNELAARLGLSEPISSHDLREVCLEADTLLWAKGIWHTTTGNRPTR